MCKIGLSGFRTSISCGFKEFHALSEVLGQALTAQVKQCQQMQSGCRARSRSMPQKDQCAAILAGVGGFGQQTTSQFSLTFRISGACSRFHLVEASNSFFAGKRPRSSHAAKKIQHRFGESLWLRDGEPFVRLLRHQALRVRRVRRIRCRRRGCRRRRCVLVLRRCRCFLVVRSRKRFDNRFVRTLWDTDDDAIFGGRLVEGFYTGQR